MKFDAEVKYHDKHGWVIVVTNAKTKKRSAVAKFESERRALSYLRKWQEVDKEFNRGNRKTKKD